MLAETSFSPLSFFRSFFTFKIHCRYQLSLYQTPMSYPNRNQSEVKVAVYEAQASSSQGLSAQHMIAWTLLALSVWIACCGL